MTDLLIKILNMSLIASVVAVGVMLVRLPLRKAPKIFSYLLWGLVLFKLVCPLTIESVRALIPVRAEPIPRAVVTAPVPQIDSGIRMIDSTVNEFLSTAPVKPAASANPMQVLLEIAAWVWIVGVVVLFAYALISYFLMKHRMKTAVKTGEAFESDRISTAFVLGFFPPKIHLPAHLSPKEREYILLHEQTHIKHLDYIIKPIVYAAVCLHWFNPLVWLSYKTAMQDMELTCDESVLRHSGADIRADYSRSLLSLSQKRSGLLSPLAFSETGVKPRIKNALHYKKPAFWIIPASIVLITAAAIIFLPNAGSVPPTSESAKADIPAGATVYELYMTMPDYAYINNIEANNDIVTEEIYKPIQLQGFSGQLGQRFHFESDLYARLDGYDEAFFQNKCLFAVILRSTKDKTCLFEGVEYTEAVKSSNPAALSDLLVSVSLKLADNGSGWVEADAWWLVLVELGPDASGRAPSDYRLGDVLRNEDASALSQQYKTVMYYTENGEDLVDRYLVKSYENGEKELCTVQGKHLLSGVDFYPLPHVIGVLRDGGWRLYDKTTFKPVSDNVYEELSCEQYPDDYWATRRLLGKRGGFWALLDGNGTELTGAVYKQIRFNTYEETRAVAVVIQNGKYGAIDYDGNVVIPPEYVYLSTLIYDDYQKDTYFVFDGKRWGILQLEDDLTANPPDWTAQVPKEVTERYSFYAPNGYSASKEDIQISALFENDVGFKILGSENGDISDEQMAIHASMHMENYSYENGNIRAEYDALTEKYFGKTLTDYTGGGMFEFIPGTDRIRAVGWSFNSGMYTLPRSVSLSNGQYTAQFYCIDVPDSYWDDSPYGFADVRRMLYGGEWGPFIESGLTFQLREVVFALGKGADGGDYPIYKSVRILQSDLKAPIQ